MKLGDKLKELRESKKLSLQQLSDKIEISKSVLWQYENNKSIPSADVIRKFVNFYNVSSDYLIYEEFENYEGFKSLNIEFLRKLNEVFESNPDYKNYFEKTIDLILEKK